MSFGASVVFYNAFLPDIAAVGDRDAVSSRGWALGYLGGGLLLALDLWLFSAAPRLGWDPVQVVRINLASAGVWWAAFTLIPLAVLRNRRPIRALPVGQGYLTTGIRQLARTLRRARAYPQTLWFRARGAGRSTGTDRWGRGVSSGAGSPRSQRTLINN